MNAEDSLKLARRFIGLPLEKRQVFLQALQKEGVDFSRFPIPAGVAVEDRQALSYAQQRMWFLWQLDPAVFSRLDEIFFQYVGSLLNRLFMRLSTNLARLCS